MMGGVHCRVSQHMVHRHSCELADNGGRRDSSYRVAGRGMVTAIAIPRSHLLRRIQLAHAGEKNRTVVVTTTAFPYISGRPVDGAINGRGDGGNL